MKNTELVEEPCLPDKLGCEQIIAAGANGMRTPSDRNDQMLWAEEPAFPQFLAEIPQTG